MTSKNLFKFIHSKRDARGNRAPAPTSTRTTSSRPLENARKHLPKQLSITNSKSSSCKNSLQKRQPSSHKLERITPYTY